MPWMGFFDKMHKVKTYVFLDNVQFRKNYFQNRNLIMAENGASDWITVPIKKTSLNTEIRHVSITGDDRWKAKYLNKIREYYSNSRNFEIIYPQLVELICFHNTNLAELNYGIIKWARKLFGIDTQLLWASDLIDRQPEGDVVMQIIKALNAREYLSGPFGKEYLNLDAFEKNGIRVTFHEYENKPNMQSTDGKTLAAFTISSII